MSDNIQITQFQAIGSISDSLSFAAQLNVDELNVKPTALQIKSYVLNGLTTDSVAQGSNPARKYYADSLVADFLINAHGLDVLVNSVVADEELAAPFMQIRRGDGGLLNLNYTEDNQPPDGKSWNFQVFNGVYSIVKTDDSGAPISTLFSIDRASGAISGGSYNGVTPAAGVGFTLTGGSGSKVLTVAKSFGVDASGNTSGFNTVAGNLFITDSSNRFVQGMPTSANDALLTGNSQAILWIDEATNTVYPRIKKSNGVLIDGLFNAGSGPGTDPIFNSVTVSNSDTPASSASYYLSTPLAPSGSRNWELAAKYDATNGASIQLNLLNDDFSLNGPVALFYNNGFSLFNGTLDAGQLYVGDSNAGNYGQMLANSTSMKIDATKNVSGDGRAAPIWMGAEGDGFGQHSNTCIWADPDTVTNIAAKMFPGSWTIDVTEFTSTIQLIYKYADGTTVKTVTFSMT
jgi:hypothetical protein